MTIWFARHDCFCPQSCRHVRAYRLESFDLKFIKTEPSCWKPLLIRAQETGVPIISMSSGRLFQRVDTHGTDARQVVVPFGSFIRMRNCGTNACYPLFKNRFPNSTAGATHPEHCEWTTHEIQTKPGYLVSPSLVSNTIHTRSFWIYFETVFDGSFFRPPPSRFDS